jgi:hypothetical protein
MIGPKRVLSFAAVLLAASFAAQATPATYVFATVTGVQYGSNASITGTFAGSTAPTTVALPLSGLDTCATFVFAMLSNPGTYTLTVAVDIESDPTLPSNITIFNSCRLDRNP